MRQNLWATIWSTFLLTSGLVGWDEPFARPNACDCGAIVGSRAELDPTYASRLGSVVYGECEMANNAFQDWRRECEAVQKEMDRLITAGRPQSPEERQVRQLQFTALLERRDAAARNLLQTTIRRGKG
jgi:hypothetical protein